MAVVRFLHNGRFFFNNYYYFCTQKEDILNILKRDNNAQLYTNKLHIN